MNQCKDCKFFMAKKQYLLGRSVYLNDCIVPIAEPTFHCAHFIKKEK